MDYFFNMYDKMIDSIVDTADLETTGGPTAAQKCADCNFKNHDKSTCECRCHFRSCGRCENEKCVIRSCLCDCHQLGTKINIMKAENEGQAIVEESIIEPETPDVSYMKEEESISVQQPTNMLLGQNLSPNMTPTLEPTNKDVNAIETKDLELAENNSKPKLRMKKKKKGELVSYIFFKT